VSLTTTASSKSCTSKSSSATPARSMTTSSVVAVSLHVRRGLPPGLGTRRRSRSLCHKSPSGHVCCERNRHRVAIAETSIAHHQPVVWAECAREEAKVNPNRIGRPRPARRSHGLSPARQVSWYDDQRRPKSSRERARVAWCLSVGVTPEGGGPRTRCVLTQKEMEQFIATVRSSCRTEDADATWPPDAGVTLTGLTSAPRWSVGLDDRRPRRRSRSGANDLGVRGGRPNEHARSAGVVTRQTVGDGALASSASGWTPARRARPGCPATDYRRAVGAARSDGDVIVWRSRPTPLYRRPAARGGTSPCDGCPPHQPYVPTSGLTRRQSEGWTDDNF